MARPAGNRRPQARAARLSGLAAAIALRCAVGAAVGLLASPAGADDPVEVTVRMKDGRALKGLLVAEAEATVTLRLAYGEMSIPRAEIAEIDRPAAQPAGSPPAAVDGPRFERQLVLTLRDGTVRRGRGEDRGDHYELHIGLGTIRIAKADVRSVAEEDVLVEARAEARAAAARERLVDAALGIEVARPSAGWRFAELPASPSGRIALAADDPAIVFEIALAEAWPLALREPSAEGEPRARALLAEELRKRYRSHKDAQVTPVRSRGLAAWRVSYDADCRGQKARAIVRELRFHHRGAQVVARATLTAERGSEAPPAARLRLLDEALLAFGFTGEVDLDDGDLIDYGLGVRVRAPPGWLVRARVLDDRTPFELICPGAPGRYRLACWPAEGVATAEAVADRLESERRRASAAYQRESRAARSVGELAAVELVHRDVGPGGALVRVRRVLIVERDRVVELVATEPADDPTLEGRRAAVEALFGSFARSGRPGLEPLVTEATRLEALLLEAQVAYDERRYDAVLVPAGEVVARRPGVGLAYLLRGRALAERGRFDEALADLDAASRLGAFAELKPVLARVQNQQAKALQKSDWRAAERLFESATKNDPDNAAYQNDLVNAVLARSRALADADKHEQATEALEAARRRYPEEERYLRALVRAHQEWAQALVGTKDLRDLYRARAVLKDAKRLDPESGKTDSLIELVEEKIKKAGGR